MDKNKNPKSEDWMTPDQQELIADLSRHWVKTKFVPVPGVWIPMESGRVLRKLVPGEAIPDGATLDAKAWDHEHCRLCWQKISEYLGDLQEGYQSEGDWLCEECFNEYIGSEEIL